MRVYVDRDSSGVCIAERRRSRRRRRRRRRKV